MAVHERLDGAFPKKEASHLVERVLGVMNGTLEGGESTKVQGFGPFVVRPKRARAVPA